MTLFFFILFASLIALLPRGASPTGNISVTATLAALTVVVVETAGVRALEIRGWARTILHVADGVSWFVRGPVLVILAPVDLMGKLTGERLWRVWRLYLPGSAKCRRCRPRRVVQLLLGRRRSDGSVTLPHTREHLYAAQRPRTGASGRTDGVCEVEARVGGNGNSTR